jgi:hypothetical protein
MVLHQVHRLFDLTGSVQGLRHRHFRPHRCNQVEIDACSGCDILMHEVNTLPLAAHRALFQAFAGTYHISTGQLSEVAIEADNPATAAGLRLIEQLLTLVMA